MKKILARVWMVICSVVLALYLISCTTAFVSPQHFSFISIFALLFPFIFLAALLCGISLFFFHRKTALVLVCLIFLAGFKNLSNTLALNSGRWKMEKAPGTLRILTWNVESFVSSALQSKAEAKPRIEILHAISKYNPDVICFQEYTDVENAENTFTCVRKELDSLGYPYFYTSNDSVIKKWLPVYIIEGDAIFSRVPLIDSGRTNLVNSTRNENLIYSDITFQKKRLRIFTGHLMSYALYGDTAKGEGNIYKETFRRKRRIEYKIRKIELEHAREVGIIRKAIEKSPEPVIYCGDLNSTPASYTYNNLKGDLQDAFVEKGFGIGGTFYKLAGTLRIDVCLHDKKLQVLQCTVPHLYLSDHFPVVTDITWK